MNWTIDHGWKQNRFTTKRQTTNDIWTNDNWQQIWWWWSPVKLTKLKQYNFNLTRWNFKVNRMCLRNSNPRYLIQCYMFYAFSGLQYYVLWNDAKDERNNIEIVILSRTKVTSSLKWLKSMLMCIFTKLVIQMCELVCLPLCVWACVCLCVCESYKEKEREREIHRTLDKDCT